MDHVEATLKQAQAEILACRDVAALKQVERRYVGKKGVVAELLATIPGLPPEQRKQVGKSANQLKQAVLAAIEARRAELPEAALASERRGRGFDPTLPPTPLQTGSLHPLTLVTRELEDLFQSMGYSVLDGPEVELDYYNFEALNIDRDPPARGSHDTFYCDDLVNLVLRTHS